MTREEFLQVLTQVSEFGRQTVGVSGAASQLKDHDAEQRAEIERLKADNNALMTAREAMREHADSQQRICIAAMTYVKQLQAQLATANEALKFYADPQTWGMHGGSSSRIFLDGGDKARQAMQKEQV